MTRRFRGRWAACARHAEATTRTISFPLDVPEGYRIDSQAFAELQSTLRDMRPGTLPWFLFTVHASGFRVFSKSDEVTAFLNRDLLCDAAYRDAIRERIGANCDTIDPVNLYLRFRTVPRPRGGTTLPFTAAAIAREYLRHFPWRGSERVEPPLAMLLHEFACRLERMGGWARVASDPTGAFDAWDEALRCIGVDVPPLATRIRAMAQLPKAVEKATIAHDPRKPRTSLVSGDALALLVADALAEARREGLAKAPELTQRVQQLLLSDNYSGLSWLWGAGLRLFKEASVADFQEWFGVDAETSAEVISAAASIPADRVFGGDSFAAYRADVGGMLASAISRCVNRLAAGPRDVRATDPTPAQQRPATVDPAAECGAGALRFMRLRAALRGYLQRITAWCDGSGIRMHPIDHRAQQERGDDDALLQAIREMLERFGTIARNKPGVVARRMMAVYEELKVFEGTKELHRYFLSGQGTLLQSASGAGEFDVVRIDPSLVDRRALMLPAIGEVIRRLEADIMQGLVDGDDLAALVELEHAYYGMIVTGLPPTVPSAVAKPADVLIPAPLSMLQQLETPTVSALVVAELFNVVARELSRLAALLARRKFLVRHALMRSRDNALLYVPKDVEWTPPPRLTSSAKPIGEAFRALKVAQGESLNPARLLASTAEALATRAGVRDWLSQSPHDWYYRGLQGGARVTGLSISKSSTPRRLTRCGALRLVGPSAMKTLLDRALLQKRGSIGDLQIVCDRQFEQHLRSTGSDDLRAEVRELSCSLSLLVPIRENPPLRFGEVTMDRYLSVDLGDDGFGWTAFDAKTHEEVASGFRIVRSLRSFAIQAKAGRRIRDGVYGFRREPDPGPGRARRRVAGDVMHAVEVLLSRFRAFPVFERNASRLPRRRGRQTAEVHRLVVQAYVFVNTESALRRRKSHWHGAHMWTHPYLMRKTGSGAIQPLTLFPGVAVPGIGRASPSQGLSWQAHVSAAREIGRRFRHRLSDA